MSRQHNLEFSEDFFKQLKILAKRDRNIKIRVDKALELLRESPFHSSLRTHKANTKQYGFKYSSRVTGDLRIIWDFVDGRLTIFIFTIKGHEVYN